MVDGPTDAEIEELLGAAAHDRWQSLWVAFDAVSAEEEHAVWAGGDQVDTIESDGVEQPVLQMPYPIYSDAVNRFVGALSGLVGVIPFKWREWEGLERYHCGEALDQAPVADAVRMITAAVRGERFGDGTILAMLENGTLPAVVRRLRRWYDEERPAK